MAKCYHSLEDSVVDDHTICKADDGSPNTAHRPDGTYMTRDQAEVLIITLDHTKTVIQNYVQRLKGNDVTFIKKERHKSWWGLHCWPRKRKWLYRYITVVTVSLQLLNLLILTLLDAWPKPNQEKPYIVASSVTMIFFQLINLVVLILASGRLVKQIYRHSVNRLFLAQTYGATILLFAGLYTLTYRIQRHSWRFINENLNENPIQVFNLYAKFLFYSISTATLCGSDNVLPDYWYNCLFAGFQMLLSFCYFASILGSSASNENAQLPISINSASFPTPPLPPDDDQRYYPQSKHKDRDQHGDNGIPNDTAIIVHDTNKPPHKDTTSNIATTATHTPLLLSNGAPPQRERNSGFPANGNVVMGHDNNSVISPNSGHSYRTFEVDATNSGQVQTY